MISKLLNILERGIGVMRSNSRMLLIGILVFVFPLLFTWLSHSFFATADANIETAQKQRVNLLHDSLATLITYSEREKNDGITATLIEYKVDNPDITAIRVVAEDDDGFRVVFATEETLVASYEQSDQLYRELPQAALQNPYIFKLRVNGDRVWQILSKVETRNQELYIFTEHNFSFNDKVMLSRKQDSYFALTAIFLFLMALAYWLNKQTFWQARHDSLKEQLDNRDMFSNMIAHEFRTPLTTIKGYSSFLEESQTISDEDLRYAKNISSSTERLVLLVNDFLEVARLQSGKLSLTKTNEDVTKVIAQVTEDLQSLAQKKNLELVFSQPAGSIFLLTDKKRVVQILTNIITNAIKYTEVGSVTIECEKETREVRIIVKDTGSGISSDDQRKLFIPFTRVGGVDNTLTTGSGLGMWITKQLVALLGGKIGVESIKGVGTHMVITFPVETY